MGFKRLPFSAIDGISEDIARAIVFERERQAFSSLEEFVTRTALPIDALMALGKAGALECFGMRRDVLWQIGVLERRLNA